MAEMTEQEELQVFQLITAAGSAKSTFMEALYKAKEGKYDVLPKNVRARLAVEAAADFGWQKYIGLDGDMICMNGFGASAPAGLLFKDFGFTVENVVEKALALVK